MPGLGFLTRQGPSPHTFSVLSQKHKVFSGAGGGATSPIGVISSFTPTETRTIEPVRGIGFGDVIAELVPAITDPATIAVERYALYVSMLQQVFGYLAYSGGLARSLSHHRWPFDIKAEIIFSDLGNTNAPPGAQGTSDQCGNQGIITWFEGCWMDNYSASYTVDAALVTESANITVTRMTDGRTSYGPCIDTGNSQTSRIFAGG